LTAIAVAGRLYQLGKIKRILIIAPLSVLGVWQEEMQKYADYDYTLAVLNQSSTPKKVDVLRHLTGSVLQVAVVNYDSLRLMTDSIISWNPDLVICDEGHRLKNHASQQSKSATKISKSAKYCLLLTGTLISNHAEDVYGIYRTLNPAVFGNVGYYAWRAKYFDSYGYGNFQFRLKKSMEEEFLRKVHSVAFRATKAQCLSLPPTVEIVRNVELEGKTEKLYRQIVKESYAEISGGEITTANVLSKLLRLSQITGGFLTNDDDGNTESVSTAKLNALEDILDDAMNENRKVVIIARFTPEIEAICKLLEKKKISYSRVDGKVKDRATEVEKFQNNPDISAFVGQIQVAGLGLTLTASSLMILYSLDYSVANHSQTLARIHRSGQTQTCSYYYLIAKNTVDEKIFRSLKQKEDFSKRMIDDFRKGINALD
jgi:SNF2 family DNA or RNA helicase